MLLALAYFADAAGLVSEATVEALRDGRLRLTVGVTRVGERVLLIDSAAGRVAEIDFAPGTAKRCSAPMPRSPLPGLPS